VTPADGVPIEVELKFRMTDAATGERLIAGDEIDGFSALGPAETTKVEDRYMARWPRPGTRGASARTSAAR
jgi:hypothetical protein